MNPYMMNYWNNALQQQQMAQQNMGQGLQSPERPSLPPLAQQQLQGFNAGDELEEEAHNPINKGIARGIEAARQSMKASDEQQRRAAGMGVLSFAENLNRGQYSPGFEGTLQNINTALSPAIKAYIQEQKEAEALNAGLMLHEQERERHALQDALAKAKFEEEKKYNKRFLDIAEKKANREGMLTKEERLEQRIEEKMKHLPPGATPLEAYPAGTQREIMQDLRKSVSAGQKAQERRRIRDRMKKISDTYPDLANDFTRIIGEELDEGSVKGIFGGMFADKKKLSALQKMAKEQQELNRHIIEGASSKMATNMYKEMISKTTPGAKLTKEAFDYLINIGNKEDEPFYHYGKEARDAIKGRYNIAPYLEEEEAPLSEKEAIIEELRRRGKR